MLSTSFYTHKNSDGTWGVWRVTRDWSKGAFPTDVERVKIADGLSREYADVLERAYEAKNGKSVVECASFVVEEFGRANLHLLEDPSVTIIY